jgi:hypothetical protein
LQIGGLLLTQEDVDNILKAYIYNGEVGCFCKADAVLHLS